MHSSPRCRTRQLDFRRLPWLLALVAGLVASAAAQQVEGSDQADEIDALVTHFVELGHLSGTLLVARADQVVYERSFGLATRSPSVANTPKTSFNVASVSKPITATIAYQLIDEGKLDGDAPLRRYFPDFPRGDEILVRHLMFHQSGLPHRVTTEEDEQRPQSPAAMVVLAAKAGLEFEPGKRRQYSSAGYSVLARVLELASGKSYSELLRERIVAPLGLVSTAHPDPGAEFAEEVASFRFSSGGLVEAPSRDYSFLVGAGSLYSIPRDLHRVMRALAGDRLGESARVGLLRLGRFQWNGMTDGYRAFADYWSQGELSVVFTGNLNSGAVEYLRRAVPVLMGGDEPPPFPELPSETVDVDIEWLESLAGIYAREGQSLDFTVEEGTLHASGWPLLPVGESRFFSPTDYGTLEVIFDDSDRAVRIDWYQGGKPFSYERQP